ncbi:class A beta-lactamase [Cytobacillus sp. FSL W7-1323]|uniref:class A beta-lactamase n=1 Tax=Cytobacillus TaxID=2675230 RepID=UPI002783E134|nr:class A beta-lactamase [Cytobacillus kochii]MDQ0186267.1 beta-lactamase class A [Cytobacillus kochii]MED1607890.1 class A beta-lactamase [Cytobacillus kochii]
MKKMIVGLFVAMLLLVGCSKENEVNGGEVKAEDVSSGKFAQLEEKYGAKLGVYAIDTGNEETVAYQEDERFAYASTFKALAGAVLLKENPISILDEKRMYTKEDLVTYSPITEKYVDEGMTLREIAKAAMQYSDNTAGNLLFAELGGPDQLEEALRAIGDDVTEMDRLETELNEATPGDTRDTSTPKALATNLRILGLTDELSEEKREIFQEWFKGNTTGDTLIKSGVPTDWIVGDKSGAASYGTRNDIAIVWPPNDEPIVIAVLSNKQEKEAEYDDQLIGEATEIVLETLTQVN